MQHAAVTGPEQSGRGASSSRRKLVTPTCSGTKPDSFVGGGSGNVADATYAGVLVGVNNKACDSSDAIAGGSGNVIMGSGNAYNSIIGAGTNNTITGQGYESSIGSGNFNSITAEDAFIGGGLENAISSEGAAAIAGGSGNAITGEDSPAGARANASRNGTFVWSDGSDGDTYLSALTAYEFLARASGGFTFLTNAGSTVGAQLAAGSGTWASLSDRNQKTNVVPLDDAAVLDKIASLPISRWSYKSERASVTSGRWRKTSILRSRSVRTTSTSPRSTRTVSR